MAAEFALSKKPGYLLCDVSGNFGDSTAGVEFFSKILTLCFSASQPKVLVDMGKTEGYPGAIERILFFEQIIDRYEAYLGSGGVAIKIVFMINPLYLSDYNPGLDVAERRRFPAAIASDLSSALNWLGLETSLTV